MPFPQGESDEKEEELSEETLPSLEEDDETSELLNELDEESSADDTEEDTLLCDDERCGRSQSGIKYAPLETCDDDADAAEATEDFEEDTELAAMEVSLDVARDDFEDTAATDEAAGAPWK